MGIETMVGLQESINKHLNIMIDNAHINPLPNNVCRFCSHYPVRKLKETEFCPVQSYHCPECKKSYWIPPKRKR